MDFSVYEILSRMDQIVGHKTRPNEFMNTEIILNILPNHGGMKLEINSRMKDRKFKNKWKLNNKLNHPVGKLRREIKKYLNINENQNTTSQNLWDRAKAVLRGKFITTNTHIRKKDLK